MCIRDRGKKRIYAVGDSAYRDALIHEKTIGADLVILPINGAFGNLNETEAAFLAKNLQAGTVIPSHFWNFAEHGGCLLYTSNRPSGTQD